MTVQVNPSQGERKRMTPVMVMVAVHWYVDNPGQVRLRTPVRVMVAVHWYVDNPGQVRLRTYCM
jgi:hypothetical protein